MSAAKQALVIGGGIAGMSAAIVLRESGMKVHLIDRDPEWKVYGAGITITGPTLRVMKRLGILDRVLAEGYTSDGLLVCDAQGNTVAEIETRGEALNGVPGAGGIMRPVLHSILSERLRLLAPRVSLGTSVASLIPGHPTQVTFTDGSTGTYDLVVGADGIFSATRAMMFPDTPEPHYVGQVCWRLMTSRHPAIERRTYFLGGPSKVGINPVSPDQMYMFLLEPVQRFERRPEGDQYRHLDALMAPYGGVVADLRAELNAGSRIVARPLETIFLRAPWYRQGCVLIGDAAHATTPQLASGAGMAMEDGVVLGECVAGEDNIEAALARFMQRRYPRCALVVEKSLTLGRLEKAVTSPIEQVRVVEQALAQLNQPY
ncbi:FAD-dependent monooxygenase [Cucumibacter marinus]|uniref:FAD-dependent monooxygenase n=1 Tax=Cucumibacter marinus TaxID=1121252 RepID=UPI00040FA2C3|nr:FAD-dependent monooxygenase [Cucumibacter marinus]